MTVILAAIDGSDAAAPVLATARAVADQTSSTLRVVHVREGDPDLDAAAAAAAGDADVELQELDGAPTGAIVHAVADPEVVLVVVGARGTPQGPRPCGHIALEVAEQVDKPVLVVPPDGGRDPSAPIRRALVPLEGTPESTAAVSEQLRGLAAAGVELTALHVFDADTVPRFWDQTGYAEESFAAEFASRWCTEPDVDIRLRRGAPGAAVVDVADAEGIDVIALGWSQNLEPGRAGVVRAVLEHACIPILLVPVAGAVSREAAPAST